MLIGCRTVVAKTCVGCGQLKLGSEFNHSKNDNKYYNSYCNRCVCKMANISTKRSNAASRDTAKFHGSRWTDHEYDHVWQLYSVGYPTKVIAMTVGRTLSATRAKIFIMRQEKLYAG